MFVALGAGVGGSPGARRLECFGLRRVLGVSGFRAFQLGALGFRV